MIQLVPFAVTNARPIVLLGHARNSELFFHRSLSISRSQYRPTNIFVVLQAVLSEVSIRLGIHIRGLLTFAILFQLLLIIFSGFMTFSAVDRSLSCLSNHERILMPTLSALVLYEELILKIFILGFSVHFSDCGFHRRVGRT